MDGASSLASSSAGAADRLGPEDSPAIQLSSVSDAKVTTSAFTHQLTYNAVSASVARKVVQGMLKGLDSLKLPLRDRGHMPGGVKGLMLHLLLNHLSKPDAASIPCHIIQQSDGVKMYPTPSQSWSCDPMCLECD